VVLVLIVAGFAWYFFNQNHRGGLVASGTIEGTEVVVSSKAIGKVLAVKVDEGDTVKEGDLLAAIDHRDADAALKNAQARYDLAVSDYERSKQLYNSSMISSQQYDQSKTNFEAASAALETAKNSYDNTDIRAPISGVVLVKAIEPGELANFGTPIVTMADLSEVKLTVYIPEKDVGKVQLGQEVAVSVDSYPNEKFIGKVIYISDKAEFTPKVIQTKEERTTQVFGVKIKIPNPEQKLKPGMPADAQFKWNSQ
jgi:HlyD family secretion protein